MLAGSPLLARTVSFLSIYVISPPACEFCRVHFRRKNSLISSTKLSITLFSLYLFPSGSPSPQSPYKPVLPRMASTGGTSTAQAQAGYQARPSGSSELGSKDSAGAESTKADLRLNASVHGALSYAAVSGPFFTCLSPRALAGKTG